MRRAVPSPDAVVAAIGGLFRLLHDESAERRDRLTALWALLAVASRGGPGSNEAKALLGVVREASNDAT